ncbi:F-box protein [Rhynchospora pubera]|uniref:F-box protein n=1 Tax=Rhynchospora pubera TaxID=906938 RepID=A0AAV8E4J9_9POAL|nr:F-box protein [Rhynchospora pubera]
MENKSTDAAMVGVGDINQLPEECISHVISLTTPRDACVSSAVSRTSHSAADSDVTWERFLPSDYDSILSRAVNPVEYSSKKELYFRLCEHPVMIDGGMMSFGLEKSSGAKCFMISARALSIVWGEDERYWKWIVLPESRFNACVELDRVCLLEICGKIDNKILTPHTTYAAYLIFKLAPNAWGLSNPFQRTEIILAGDIVSQHCVCLNIREREQFNPWWDRPLPGGDTEEMSDDVILPKVRGDGWLEVKLGEFNSGDGIDGDVSMSLTENKGGHWKNGLILIGIEVRPKH